MLHPAYPSPEIGGDSPEKYLRRFQNPVSTKLRFGRPASKATPINLQPASVHKAGYFADSLVCIHKASPLYPCTQRHDAKIRHLEPGANFKTGCFETAAIV
jgi:hypothetical protein